MMLGDATDLAADIADTTLTVSDLVVICAAVVAIIVVATIQ